MSCPECGHNPHEATEAQSRISDLETQVRLLNNRASSYMNRLADYEDEIRNLRTQCARLQKERDSNISVAPLQSQSQSHGHGQTPIRSQSQPQTPSQPQSNRESLPPPPIPEKDPVVERPSTNRQSLSRLSSFTSYLPGRRKDTDDTPPVPPLSSTHNQSTSNLHTPTSELLAFPSPPPYSIDPSQPKAQSLTLMGLQTKLETERHLRQEAEKNLTDAQSELEELTAQLFGQANEMVAQERKARAKLEERVKLLETRDGEKRRRLERLEGAVARIERVRRLVVEHERELEGAKEREREVEGVLQRRVSEKMMNLRHAKTVTDPQIRTKNRRARNAKGRGGVQVWNDEDEEANKENIAPGKVSSKRNDSVDEGGYEFDVQLKVWRRSRANMWRVPTFE